MNVKCPLCHRPLALDDALAGKLIPCPECGGTIQLPSLSVGPKFVPREEVSVLAAALLNWLWPGAGYFVIRQPKKGIVFCCITGFMLILVVMTCGLGLLLHIPYGITCIIDAVLVSQRINRGETVDEWTFF